MVMILTVILAVGCRAAGAETDFGAGDVPGSLRLDPGGEADHLHGGPSGGEHDRRCL